MPCVRKFSELRDYNLLYSSTSTVQLESPYRRHAPLRHRSCFPCWPPPLHLPDLPAISYDPTICVYPCSSRLCMPDRPPLHALPGSSSSSAIQIHHAPINKLYPLFANLTFHIVPAKIGESIGQIYECVDELGGRCVSVEEARFVVTELRGRPRLVRAIGKEWIVRRVQALNRLEICSWVGRIPNRCSLSSIYTTHSNDVSTRRTADPRNRPNFQ